MRRRFPFIAVLPFVLLAAPALASGGLAWPVPATAPLLGYGAAYSGPDGATRTHSGIDIALEAGDEVAACADGVVSFAGLVPAGDARVLAVTIETPEGLSVTCMPLASASVSRGASVSAGEAIGEAAGLGDASSAAPHLHLGVRRGDTYLDPMSLLPEAEAPAPGPGTPEPVPAEVRAPEPEAAPPAAVAPPAVAARAVEHAAPVQAPAPAQPVPAPQSPQPAPAAHPPAAAPSPAAAVRHEEPLGGTQVAPASPAPASAGAAVRPGAAAAPRPVTARRVPVREEAGSPAGAVLAWVGESAPAGRKLAACALAAAVSLGCAMMAVRGAAAVGGLGVTPSVEKARVEDAVGR